MKVSVIVAAALFFAVQQSTPACSCVPPPPPDEALEASSAVFAGIVLDVEDHSIIGDNSISFRNLTVTILVTRHWKGVYTPTVQVTTESTGAGCGYPFQEGSSYLVYANGKDLFVTSCSRTRPLRNARDDLDVLGRGTLMLPGWLARLVHWILSLLCALGFDVCHLIPWV